MVRVVIDRDGERFRWRLVQGIRAGADVLARGVRTYDDERSCYRAAATMCRMRGEAMLTVQQPDGHWRWVVCGPDGRPLAESPAVFTDAAGCGKALVRLCRHLAALTGAEDSPAPQPSSYSVPR